MDYGLWALALLSAFLVGLSKTGIAGLGILPVAIFAGILPARESVGVVLIVLLAGDLVAVTVYRREADWGHLMGLFPWAGAGIVLGALAFGQMNDATVRVLIGSILVGLVLLQWFRRARPVEVSVGPPARWIVIGTGVGAGFTTMVANAAGPLMVMYLLAMRLPKLIFVGTAAWFFLAVNVFKVPFSYSLGLITAESLGLSLRLAPFAVLGALSGRWVLRRIDQRLFEMLALGLTFVAGWRLILM